MNALTNRIPARAVLHVRVGEGLHANLARAREAMQALQQGRRPNWLTMSMPGADRTAFGKLFVQVPAPPESTASSPRP